MDSLPAPLIPPEVDLRDFQFMPIVIGRLFGSDFHSHATDSEWRAGVTLWLKAWHQLPAGSLPDDDVSLCRLAELGRDLDEWRRIKAGALRGWVKCSDGRLYHRVVCAEALDAWKHKLARVERTRKATEERERRRNESAAVERNEQRDVKRDDTRYVHQGTGTGTVRSQDPPLTTSGPPKGGSPPKATKFTKPLPAEVTAYAATLGYTLDGAAFCDHYESKGWLIGKSPMRSWKAAVRTWKHHENHHQPGNGGAKPSVRENRTDVVNRLLRELGTGGVEAPGPPVRPALDGELADNGGGDGGDAGDLGLWPGRPVGRGLAPGPGGTDGARGPVATVPAGATRPVPAQGRGRLPPALPGLAEAALEPGGGDGGDPGDALSAGWH